MTSQPRSISVRRAHLEANVFELFVALLACVSAISYFVDPHTASGLAVTHVAFPDLIWNLLYGAGAALVVAGLASLRGQVEAAGLVLFAGAVTIQALAVAQIGGWSALVGILILGSFAAASLVRVMVIAHAIRALRRGDTVKGPSPP